MERKAPNTDKGESYRTDSVSHWEGLLLSCYYAEESQAYRVEIREGLGHFGNVTGELVVGFTPVQCGSDGTPYALHPEQAIVNRGHIEHKAE